MIDIIQIAECPGRIPRASFFSRLGQRATEWLANRAAGRVATRPEDSAVR